jgi:hypothetical protein
LSDGQCKSEENKMNNRLLMSVAAAALIAGSGLATAQSPGTGREAPAAGATKSAPSADRAAPVERAAPINKDEATDTMKRSESGSDIKAAPSDDKMKRDNGTQRATDSTRDGAAPKSATTASDKSDPSKAGKDMKAEGRSATDSKTTETKSTTTTGQAGAAGKLSTEQRTKITTVIKQQKVQPVTNVNFSISIGTRVPREVHFHPLPAEIITVYPDWRGYEFFLVRDEIIVVNPRTLEIVAVLEA